MAPNEPNMTIKPFTPEMEDALLNAEAEKLAGRGVEDGADAGDAGAADLPEQGRVEPEAGERKTVQASPQDLKRAAIAARFKPGAEPVPFDGDMTRPENMYGTAAAEQLEPEPTAEGDAILGDAQQQEPEPQPQMITRVVRGKNITKSLDEWLQLATKVDAADSYLEEGRSLLEDAKTLKATRAGQDAQHPERQSGAQDDGQGGDRQNDPQHPEDLNGLVEQLQFGDPKEAARLLQEAIQREAGKIATKVSDEGHQARLFNNDLARSQKDLAAFKAANPDLDSDPIASIAIEKLMYEQYREDIVKLGVVDESQIPSDPRELANWHRFYKVNGHPVRNTPDLLNTAKEKLVAWRGGTSKPAPQRTQQPARVEVNVNRDTRRAAIPLQPTRAVAPRRDAVANPQTKTGSDVVKDMRRARGQPVA